MAYWNHFSQQKYKQIKFIDLKVGDKFRKDFFKNKKTSSRRSDIICIKTSELTYAEQRSKKEHAYIFVTDETLVSSYNELAAVNVL